jgi:hypothetical protein
MKVLVEKKLVKKVRISLDSSNIYFMTRPLSLEHSLGVSWSYVWVNKTLKQNEKILTWELEQLKEFGAILQCDALCSIENQITKEVRWYCIEFDRSSVNKSRFDKIEKYNLLYQKYGFASSPLIKRLGNTTRFPRVIIITDTAKRALNIRDIIQSEKQKDGVNFEIHLLSEVIKEATQCTLSH